MRGPRTMMIVYCLLIAIGIAASIVLGVTHQ
jgi:hypothetical protein